MSDQPAAAAEAASTASQPRSAADVVVSSPAAAAAADGTAPSAASKTKKATRGGPPTASDSTQAEDDGKEEEKDGSVSGKKEKAKRPSRRAAVKCPKGTRDTSPSSMRIRERAFSLVKSVFQRHGAVSIDTPAFELKETLTGKYGEDSKLIYDLADQGGEICALRYDLTVPFARYCGEHGVERIKRYHLGRVYRRDQPAISKGRFREFWQCDYDVAGQYAAMVPDSDCLAVACEVLDALPIGGYRIKLSHRRLINAMMAVCGVPHDKLATICSAIDKLDKEEWTAVKQEMMQKGLTEETADRIGGYVLKHKGDPFTVLAELQQDALLSAHAEAQAAFADLTLLFNYLTALNCYGRISFDLSLARGLAYYTGIIYEAVLTSETSSLGSIAAGGRYDNMIGDFFTARDKVVPAVGISIGIERIFTLLEEEEKKKQTPARGHHTLVLVASVGPDLLTTRMATAAMLWAAGVSAQFLYDVKPSPKKQIGVAVDESIPIIVWHGETEEKQGIVNVKNMLKSEEVKVPKTELLQTVLDMIKTLPPDV